MLNCRAKIIAIILGIIGMLPFTAFAEMKIGYVDSAKIMELAPQAQKFKEILDKEFEPRRNKLLKKQNEIKSLEESAIRDAAIMGEAERIELERKVRSLKRDMRRMQEEFSDEVTIKRDEELMKLQKKVVGTIQDFAKKNNYDLIINESVVVFASSSIDITDDVLKSLRAKK